MMNGIQHMRQRLQTLEDLIYRYYLRTRWNTIHSLLALTVRQDCFDLAGLIIEGSHELQLEKPAEINEAIEG